MTTKLAILLGLLLAGLSSVFLLPAQLGYQPVGAKFELPDYLGGWLGKDAPITDKERIVLTGSDFARKVYTNGRGDRITVSLIVAGQDMMSGIHRPERCLEAQGWTCDVPAERRYPASDGKPLKVTRLLNTRQVLADGKPIPFRDLAYYWFIGYTREVASHGGRVWWDALDRLIKGYNQRWAMVLVNSDITKGFQLDGRDEAETDKLLQELTARMAPKIVEPSVVR